MFHGFSVLPKVTDKEIRVNLGFMDDHQFCYLFYTFLLSQTKLPSQQFCTPVSLHYVIKEILYRAVSSQLKLLSILKNKLRTINFLFINMLGNEKYFLEEELGSRDYINHLSSV